MSEWKTVRLGDICTIKGRIGFRGYTTEDFVENPKDGAITLSPSNIIDGEIDVEKCKYVTWAKYDESPEIMVKVNDIVLGKTAAIGRTALIRRIDHPMTINPQLVLLSDVSEDVEYISYYLKSQDFQGALSSITVGSVVPTLSQKNLAKLELHLPSPDTQHRIAAILSSLDAQIENNNRINANLEAQAQALFKSWFVDFEPWGGVMPEDWREGNIFDIADILDKKRKPLSSNERDKMKKVYPYYGATSCMDYVEDYLFDGCYTLLGEDGSVIKEDGTPYVQYVWGKLWVNNHAHVLQGKNGYSTEMLHTMLSQLNIAPLITGAVQAKLNQGNMQKIKVIIATDEVMQNASKTICSLYAQIRNNTETNARLAALRDTLLPKLMKGEIEL